MIYLWYDILAYFPSSNANPLKKLFDNELLSFRSSMQPPVVSCVWSPRVAVNNMAILYNIIYITENNELDEMTAISFGP